MSEPCKNEWCDERGELNDDGECSSCEAERKQIAAYYKRLYTPAPHYTREEIMDAYSDPGDYQKRERMLRWNR